LGRLIEHEMGASLRMARAIAMRGVAPDKNHAFLTEIVHTLAVFSMMKSCA